MGMQLEGIFTIYPDGSIKLMLEHFNKTINADSGTQISENMIEIFEDEFNGS